MSEVSDEPIEPSGGGPPRAPDPAGPWSTTGGDAGPWASTQGAAGAARLPSAAPSLGGPGAAGPAYGGYGIPLGAAAPEPAGPRWGMGDVAVGVLLYFGAQVVAAIVLVAYLVLTGELDTMGTADELTEDIGLVSVLIGVPLAWLVLFGWPWWLARRKGSGSLARDFGWAFRPIDLATGLGGGIVGLLAAGGAALAFQALVGHEAPTNTDIIPSEGLSPLVMVLVFLVIAVGTPIAEEVFFRGLFMGAARKAWGTKVAVVASSVGFGLAHVQPSPTGWLYVGAVTGAYGFVFAMLRVWSDGRLAAPIVAHMTVNAVGVVAVFATS